jgi:hypothetical protein
VEGIVAATALPWRVSAAWTEHAGTVLCAELVDKRTGGDRSIRLSAATFGSEGERREEIVRQLTGGHGR